jgi:hypothetical protein
MKYRYNYQSGVTHIKTNTKKYVTGFISALLIAGGVTATTFAAQPASPGCFGQDRAAYNKNTAQTSAAEPGASETGHILAERASTNGDMNRDYKTACGGDSVQL